MIRASSNSTISSSSDSSSSSTSSTSSSSSSSSSSPSDSDQEDSRPIQAALVPSDLYEVHPSTLRVRRDNRTDKVWLLDTCGADTKELGTAKWVRGMTNVKFECALHKKTPGASCGLILSMRAHDSACHDLIDKQLDRFYTMAAAYKTANLTESKRHHREEAQRMRAFVKHSYAWARRAERAAGATAAAASSSADLASASRGRST